MHPEQQISASRVEAIAIRELTPADKARWDNFVDHCPEATFFHRAGWQEAIARAFGHATYYRYAERDGVILAVLPLVHVRSRIFGNALTSTPFCVYGGIAAMDDDARAALDLAAQELARKLNVDYLEYRSLTPRHPEWPTKNLYVTFRKTIDPDVEQNMKNIPRKQRAMVRKGIDAGLQGMVEHDAEHFYRAYSESVHALGTPVFSRRYFEILREVFREQSDILTITKDGRLVGSVLNFYFRDEVLPYYGGGTAEARELKGNDFMYWDLLRRSCERGLRVFDYGRSKQGSGSYSFKKNWGFEPQPLYYEYFLVKAKAVPDVSPMNPKFRLFIAVWKQLPLRVTQWLGPHIVKYLG
jgi:FemAB-related protein (PEP-CTERM system-associated)